MQVLESLAASPIFLGTATSGKDFPLWHLETALECHCELRLWGAVKAGAAAYQILCGLGGPTASHYSRDHEGGRQKALSKSQGGAVV